MKSFYQLIKREWWEWRTVAVIVSVLFALGLVISAYSSYKISAIFQEHAPGMTFNHRSEGHNKITRSIDDEAAEEARQVAENEDYEAAGDEQDHDPYRYGFDDGEWVAPRQLFSSGLPGRYLLSGNDSIILFGWTHMQRGTLTIINILLVMLALFYLVDAIFKERADGSTFFYRSMPLADEQLLLSKLVFGTIGFLVASIVLGFTWYVFSRLTFPSAIAQMMSENGFSLGQVAVWDLILDWLAFHLLQLLWLLPYAVYLLLVSATTRSRPLLVAIILPIVVGLIWRYFTGNVLLIDVLTANMRMLAETMMTEWGSQNGPGTGPGETVEMFGTFRPYIFSLRSLISLVISGLLGWATVVAYRRNLPTS